MRILAYRNVKPITCKVCGCEYEYDVGDVLHMCWEDGGYAFFLQCPTCLTDNDAVLEETKTRWDGSNE